MWENKSGAGADPDPFWTCWSSTCWSSNYTLLSATLPLNVRILLSDPFSDGSSFYIACVCNHCHRTNQNCRSMMGPTSHLSCVCDAFSSYCVSFSLMTSLTMMVLGPSHLVRALIIFLWKFRWWCQWLKIRWSCQWTILRWSCQWNIFISSSQRIRWSCQWNILRL